MDFNTLKDKAANVNVESVSPGSVTDIELQEGVFTFDDQPLTEDARQTFLKNIKFSDSTYKKLNKKLSEDELRKIISYFVEDVENPNIFLQKENNKIVSISDARRASFDNLQILETTEKLINDNKLDVDIAQTSFINSDGVLKLDLVNNQFAIDVFKELGLDEGYTDDVYKFGTTIYNDQRGMKGSSVESYILRLICANGMVTNEMNYRARVKNKDPFEAFVKKIGKSLTDEEILKQFESSMLNNIERLFTTQASVNELENTINVFGKYYIGEEEREEDNALVSDKENSLYDLFQYDEVSKRYGKDIKEQTPRWKSTANTGMRLYDLMNISTYLISHNKLDGLNTNDKVSINRDIMDTFFRKEYDLENVAPTLNINDDILANVRQKYLLN